MIPNCLQTTLMSRARTTSFARDVASGVEIASDDVDDRPSSDSDYASSGVAVDDRATATAIVTSTLSASCGDSLN